MYSEQGQLLLETALLVYLRGRHRKIGVELAPVVAHLTEGHIHEWLLADFLEEGTNQYVARLQLGSFLLAPRVNRRVLIGLVRLRPLMHALAGSARSTMARSEG